MFVPDEVCKNEEYQIATNVKKVKSFGRDEIFPEKYTLDGLEGIIDIVEEYFEDRKSHQM